MVSDPNRSATWGKLKQHVGEIAQHSLSELLADDARNAALMVEAGDVCADFSRMHATPATLDLLTALADERDLATQIEALFQGETVNNTEGRAALHTALRDPKADADVSGELQRFLDYADAVRSGALTGSSGAAFRTIVNIGIGGSDLGPRFVTAALRETGGSDAPDVRFVAGLDGIELRRALSDADPASTLFIVCSKTFTTLETLTNARAARDWLAGALGEASVTAHFAAVSVNASAMDEFGVGAEARFVMWDWVGGRYSVWSPVGLSLAIAIGAANFRELLAGAHAMDTHFRRAPLQENIPVLHGLLSVWQQNFIGLDQHLVLPYDERLRLLPEYLQQLWMESLGKSVRKDGTPVDYPTGASLWGSAGSASQHSFAQWLHQGTAKTVVDYVGTANGMSGDDADAHLQSLANMLAQVEVLARGSAADSGAEELRAHRAHPGNRPSTILLLRELTPAALGMLLAIYEHSVYVQSVIWGINPFDQYGVEQGKAVARERAAELEGDPASLSGLARRIRDWRDG